MELLETYNDTTKAIFSRQNDMADSSLCMQHWFSSEYHPLVIYTFCKFFIKDNGIMYTNKPISIKNGARKQCAYHIDACNNKVLRSTNHL